MSRTKGISAENLWPENIIMPVYLTNNTTVNIRLLRLKVIAFLSISYGVLRDQINPIDIHMEKGFDENCAIFIEWIDLGVSECEVM